MHNLPRASVSMVDATRCIYQANTNQRVTGVFERTAIGRLVEITSIFSGEPRAGEVLIDQENGLLRFGASPSGQIECDTVVRPPSSGGTASADQQTIIALLRDIRDLLHKIAAGGQPTRRATGRAQ